MENNNRNILATTGVITAFAITTTLTLWYYLNDTYVNKQHEINTFEKELRERESKLIKQEILIDMQNKNILKRENALKTKEKLCSNNYVFNSLLNEYKQLSGVNWDTEYSACSDETTLNSVKCIEVKEKRQKAFSILNQTCLYVLKNNKLDDNFKNFIYAEKVRLSDTRNLICEDVVTVKWKK